jgi:peroxiredoxin
MKNLIFIKAAIATLLFSLYGYNTCSAAKAEQIVADTTSTQLGIGDVAPEFTLPDMDENLISSRSLKGKYVVIHFATTWCPFCNAEAPHLEQLYQEYKKRDVQVLIIDVREPRYLIAQKLRDKYNLTLPILLDEDGKVATHFAPSDALPDLSRDEVMLASNLIIDTEGRIRYMSLLNTQNFDAKLIGLKKKLDELLDEQNKLTAGNDFIQLKGVRSSEIGADGQGMVTVLFQIKEGYHIQANKVNDDNLIPVKLEFETVEGISMGEPVFPGWREFKMEGTPDPFLVFDEILDVKIPVSVDHRKISGDLLLKGNLYYQACDSKKCFFPRDFRFEVNLTIAETHVQGVPQQKH